MSLPRWRRWAKHGSNAIPRQPRRRAATRLRLEPLEARRRLATRTWTGLGNGNWMTAANWNGGTQAPSPGDDLVFPSGAGQLANTNDFADGTAFNSITFTGT